MRKLLLDFLNDISICGNNFFTKILNQSENKQKEELLNLSQEMEQRN